MADKRERTKKPEPIPPQLLHTLQPLIRLVLDDLVRLFVEEHGQAKELAPVQSAMLESVIEKGGALQFGRLKENLFLQALSASRCESASLRLLALLEARHREDFRRFVLLNTADRKQSPFKKNPDWTYHSYALFRYQNGRWYACSPANYSGSGKNFNPLEGIITAKSLPALLAKIEKDEGGNWHADDSDFTSYLERRDDGDIEFFSILPNGRLFPGEEFNHPQKRARTDAQRELDTFLENSERGSEKMKLAVRKLLKFFSKKN